MPRPPNNAVVINDLVEKYEPLARSLARRRGEWFPWLRDDLLSAAFYGLFTAAQTWDPGRGCTFASHARRRILWGMATRIERERATNPLAFRPQRGPNHEDDHEMAAIDMIPARDLPPEEVVELAEEVAGLPRLLATLPADRRSNIVRHVADGETLREIAEDIGVSHQTTGKHVGRDLEKLRLAAIRGG